MELGKLKTIYDEDEEENVDEDMRYIRTAVDGVFCGVALNDAKEGDMVRIASKGHMQVSGLGWK